MLGFISYFYTVINKMHKVSPVFSMLAFRLCISQFRRRFYSPYPTRRVRIFSLIRSISANHFKALQYTLLHFFSLTHTQHLTSSFPYILLIPRIPLYTLLREPPHCDTTPVSLFTSDLIFLKLHTFIFTSLLRTQILTGR